MAEALRRTDRRGSGNPKPPRAVSRQSTKVRNSALTKQRAHHLMNAAAFAERVSNWKLAAPVREAHARPLLEDLERDDDQKVRYSGLFRQSRQRYGTGSLLL
jgi:hypothetical protein